MRIAPIINFNTTNYNKPKKQQNFTANYDYGKVKEQTGDGYIYKRGNIHNYSSLARDLQLFLEMPQILEERFPDGVKIYDYGCSVGYEPTSIVLGLHNHFPEDKASQYLPIYARDNNSYAIKNASEYRLRLDEVEENKIRFFENINKDDFFITRRTGKDGQKIHDCTDKIKNEIIYEKGDLFEDLDNDKLSEEPCVVLLRNTWQFMTPTGISELSNKLYSKLQPKSIVIIGANDIGHGADRNLIAAGFKPVEKECEMTFSNKVLGAKYTDLKDFDPLRTKHFCFEKE